MGPRGRLRRTGRARVSKAPGRWETTYLAKRNSVHHLLNLLHLPQEPLINRQNLQLPRLGYPPTESAPASQPRGGGLTARAIIPHRRPSIIPTHPVVLRLDTHRVMPQLSVPPDPGIEVLRVEA
jgi:hypothetical protein